MNTNSSLKGSLIGAVVSLAAFSIFLVTDNPDSLKVGLIWFGAPIAIFGCLIGGVIGDLKGSKS